MTSNALATAPQTSLEKRLDAAAVGRSADIVRHSSLCVACNLRGLCMPCCGLSGAEMGATGQLGFRRLRVRKGEYLYRSGDPFIALFAVRSGFFKSNARHLNNCLQVLGFSMTGEVLGIEGIGPLEHTCNAIALEDSEVCAIPFAELQDLAREIPRLQRQLHKTMGREIVRRHEEMLLLGSMTAQERLAMFLIDISRRLAARGYSSLEFNLRMTREDIGSYLGLTLGTVSRMFSKFQRQEVIKTDQKFVRILDCVGLERLTGRAVG